ncbi:MAG: OmpA family protein [candidate division WOR-3 bacterium]|nr:MAG: OmpA family protein [candidate division WOR-3 bacterium]
MPLPEPEPVVVQPEHFYLEPVYFGLDKSNIRTPAAEVLKRNADAILARVEAGQEPEVVVEGHCCPLATAEYNMALGMRRARAARDFLVGLRVDSALLKTVSYGEERVVTQDASEYYLNRRCEFRIQEEEKKEDVEIGAEEE